MIDKQARKELSSKIIETELLIVANCYNPPFLAGVQDFLLGQYSQLIKMPDQIKPATFYKWFKSELERLISTCQKAMDLPEC